MTDAVVRKSHAPFRPGVVIALVLTAVFALSAIGVLGAFAPELSRGDDGRAHALSKSAVGYGGAVKLLQAMDRRVVLNRGSINGLSPDGLLVLTPPAQPDQKTLNALYAHQGDVLIVLPKWEAMPSPTHRGWAGALIPILPEESLGALPDDIAEGATLTTAPGGPQNRLYGADDLEVAIPPTQGLRSISGGGWEPVLVDQVGRAVLARNESTGVYVLADPDLLNTRGLDNPVKARAVLDLFDSLAWPEQSIVFDLSLNGFGRSRSVLRLLLEPPLLGFTLCLVLATALVGWQAAIRFAPHLHARRAVALGKTALADNTAALVRLARRERSMATPYAELIRSQAAKAVAAPPNLSPEALTALLDRLAARQGGETPYNRLAEDAADAKSASDLMAVARALTRWKSEMTRGRG